MSDQTSIEWADSTFNPWMGCTKVSPACDHCYAERDTRRFGRVEWGAGKPRVRTSEANWKQVERWNRADFVQCPSCGWRGDWSGADVRGGCCPQCNHLPERFILARRRVFCASLADWLDNEVPIEWLVDLLDLIRRTPNLDWLLLSKRVGNWRGRIEAARNSGSASVTLMNWLHDWLADEPPANVWLGSTAVNQAEADRDVPKLLAVPARVRFLSIEPMLGAIDVTPFLWGKHKHVDGICQHCPLDADCECGYYTRAALQLPALHWMIGGGESGPHARPSHPDWYRSLRDQCAAAGVAFMVKQLSSGGSKPIKNLSEFPSDLRIRQFPEMSS